MMPLSLFHPAAPYGHSAVLSPCRTWRYALERRWGSGPFVLFVGLNPSTADENVDDQTIRRCIRYGKDWGFGGLLMGNLYAYRATQQADLALAPDPVGPDCDVWLTTMSVRAGLVVAAWGANPGPDPHRPAHAIDLLGELHVLGFTKSLDPRHPSRMRADARPIRWTHG